MTSKPLSSMHSADCPSHSWQPCADNLFESEYCIKEMEAAIEYKRNIILVVKEGSR